MTAPQDDKATSRTNRISINGGDGLRQLLPHIILIAFIILTLGMLVQILAPLATPLIMAGCLGLLGHPILYGPILSLLEHWFPKLPGTWRRELAGFIATVVLVTVILVPLILVAAGLLGSFQALIDTLIGIATGNSAEAMAPLIAAARKLAQDLSLIIPVDPEPVIDELVRVTNEAKQFSRSFLASLAGGTSTLVQVVLTIIFLPPAFVHGGQVIAYALRLTPLSPEDVGNLGSQHRNLVLRLLNDTLAMALLRGTGMALIVWGIIGLPLLPTFLLGCFVSLMPVVGPAMVWLPLSILTWSQGLHGKALTLVIACIVLDIAISRLRSLLNRRLGVSWPWLGTLLFLGTLGGLLAHGATGLVIGPALVVLTVLIANVCIPIYGLHSNLGPSPVDSDASTPS